MALTLRLAEWVITNTRWILMGGMALILVSVQFDGPGVFTGSSAVWLGASGGVSAAGERSRASGCSLACSWQWP